MAGIIVYGIANCDTVKRARAWLAERGVEYAFHDYKKAGVPADRLDAWFAALGWERLLNRQGSTWRKLDAAAQAAAGDVEGSRRLMLQQPSVIRRPVVQWADDSLSVGFDAEAWQQRLS